MSSSFIDYASKVSSFNSLASSAASVMATATVKDIYVTNSNIQGFASASAQLLSNQQVLETATASQAIQSASQAIAQASAEISVLVQNNNAYGIVPSFGGNLTMAIAMGVFTLFHTVLGIFTKQWWFGTAFFCGCGLEMAGYIGRTISNNNVDDTNCFLVQIICLTIAPVFIMGGIYYLLSKFIIVYGTQFALLKPIWYSYIFITCDIISLVIQAAGGAIAATAMVDDEDTDDGTHIMVAGLAFQVFSMSIFIALYLHFLWKIKYATKQFHQQEEFFNPKYAHIRTRFFFSKYPTVVFLAVMFVYVRCIYRVIELAEGWSGFLITHEIYFMILDALMMGLTSLLLIPFHPGFIFGRNEKIKVPSGGGMKKLSFKRKKKKVQEEESKELSKFDDAQESFSY